MRRRRRCRRRRRRHRTQVGDAAGSSVQLPFREETHKVLAHARTRTRRRRSRRLMPGTRAHTHTHTHSGTNDIRVRMRAVRTRLAHNDYIDMVDKAYARAPVGPAT